MTTKIKKSKLITALKKVVRDKDISIFWYLFVAKIEDWADELKGMNDDALEEIETNKAIATTNLPIRILRDFFKRYQDYMRNQYAIYKEAEEMYGIDPIDINNIIAKGSLRSKLTRSIDKFRKEAERFERMGMRKYLSPNETKILDFIKNLTVEKVLEYFNSSDMLGL